MITAYRSCAPVIILKWLGDKDMSLAMRSCDDISFGDRHDHPLMRTQVILKWLGGKDDVPFSVGSEGAPGVLRNYSSVESAVAEVGDSRFYAGVHFRKAKRGRRAAGQGGGQGGAEEAEVKLLLAV